jgi:DNA-directed RNA polymerase subunit RPC12/RpoP
LRVTRKGAEVTCWAAEGAAGDFRELCRFDFVTADLSMVRLGGYTGFAPHAVDLRILDLKVRSDAPLADQALDAPEPDATAPHAGRRGWLVTAELLGLLILALLGGWLYARQRRRTRETAAPSPLPAGQALPEAAPVAVSFACSTCGKKLKVKAELAGKKVKCPQCGKAALVPGTRADEAGPTPS